MKIDKRVAPIIFPYILVMLCDLFNILLPSFFKYTDEVIVILAFIMWIMRVINKRNNNGMFIYILVLFLLGIAGNIIYIINDNYKNVVIDCFSFFKPMILLLYILSVKEKYHWDKINYLLVKISKNIIIILTAGAIVSMFKAGIMQDIEGNFSFFTEYCGTIGFWCITFLAILYENMNNKFLIYYFLTVFIILRTGSGLALLSAVIMFAMYLFIGKKKKFKWYYIFILVPIALYVSRDEISNYLLNQNAPRALLIRYSFITANKYFPFGSGFGTFGSRVAAEDYSQLYKLFGFNRIWGLSEGYHPYLLDNYYPQIIGQTGYLGCIAFVMLIISILKKIVLMTLNSWKKYGALYLIACWLIAGLGFNNTGSWGTITMGLVPVIAFSNSRK